MTTTPATFIPEPISTFRALDLLKKAVAEKGEEYVYPTASCVNVRLDDDGHYQPSCIVGHALVLTGSISPDLIAKMGFQNSSVSSLSDPDEQPEPLVVFETGTAQGIWEIAQQFQDNGYPWGTALEAAELVAAGESLDSVWSSLATGLEPSAE